MPLTGLCITVLAPSDRTFASTSFSSAFDWQHLPSSCWDVPVSIDQFGYGVGCGTPISPFHDLKMLVYRSLSKPQRVYSGSDTANVELPQNIGLGIANYRLLDGRLLLAADLLYKQWTDSDLFGELYHDQWIVQLGSQYTIGRVRLRLGYAWAENPIRDNPGQSAGGVSPPNGRPVVEYAQSTLAVANEHRISAGVGICNVLPGIDFDLFAGGMFEASQDFAGGAIMSSLESYWIGAGLTWRFGRGASECLHIPSQW